MRSQTYEGCKMLDIQNSCKILGSKIRTIQTLRGSSEKRLPLAALQRSIVSWDYGIASDDKAATMDRVQKSMSGRQTKVMQSLRTIVLPVNDHIDVNVSTRGSAKSASKPLAKLIKDQGKAQSWRTQKSMYLGSNKWQKGHDNHGKIGMSPRDPGPLSGHNQAQPQHNKTYSTFLGRGWNFDNV